MKKYLKTPEDVLALKNTDTKIYSEIDKLCELKFIDGILCKIDKKTHCIDFNIDIYLDPDNDVFYILEEEQEATEDDIGKLCWFWNDDENEKKVDVLKEIDKRLHQKFVVNLCYFHCRKLSPSEVAELTGYKVEEE